MSIHNSITENILASIKEIFHHTGGPAVWVLTIGLLLILNNSDLEAKSTPGEKFAYGPYQARLLRVIDGDTLELEVAVWPSLVQKIRLRLDGVNTPEKRGKGVSDCEKSQAKKASAFTKKFVKNAQILIIRNIRLGKYAGRVLGKLHADNKDLGQALIKAGLARPYSGGTRKPWCTVICGGR